VVAVGLGQRLGGRGQRRRFQDGEQLIEDGVLQPDTTDALAHVLTGIELFGAGTHVPRAVALGPRIAGLHDPPTPTTAQQALQQRPALPHRAAGQLTGTAPITAQPCGIGLEGLPGDEPPMMIGNQDLPLLAGYQPIPRMHGPAFGVDPLLGARATEHERPGIGRVGQEVVHRGVGGLGPDDPLGTVAPTREQHTVFTQSDQYLPSGAEFVETAEHRGDRLAHRLVGAQHHLVILVVVQPDRKALA
jgi:hypothetical protein